MMQTCPRCGFVQPEDKYCANCGLDIETYKPAPTPFFKKIAKNTAFQISVVVLIVIAVTIALLMSQNDRLEKRLNSNPVQRAHILRSMREPPAPTRPAVQPSAVPQPQQPAAPLPRAPIAQTKPKIGHDKKNHEITAAPTELSIAFYEMSRAALMQLASEGQVLSESAESRSMTLPTHHPLQKLREKDPATRSLGESITQNLQQGTPITLDFMRPPSAATAGMNGIGVTINLNPVKVTGTDIELALDLLFNMRNRSGNSLITNEVNSNFSFSPKSTLVLTGFFPHRKVFRQDLLAFNGTPIAIFASPAFQNSVTDLVIVIEPK